MTKRKEFIIDLLHFTLLAKRVQFSRSFYVANPLLYYAKLLKILTPKLSPICIIFESETILRIFSTLSTLFKLGESANDFSVKDQLSFD